MYGPPASSPSSHVQREVTHQFRRRGSRPVQVQSHCTLPAAPVLDAKNTRAKGPLGGASFFSRHTSWPWPCSRTAGQPAVLHASCAHKDGACPGSGGLRQAEAAPVSWPLPRSARTPTLHPTPSSLGQPRRRGNVVTEGEEPRV